MTKGQHWSKQLTVDTPVLIVWDHNDFLFFFLALFFSSFSFLFSATTLSVRYRAFTSMATLVVIRRYSWHSSFVWRCFEVHRSVLRTLPLSPWRSRLPLLSSLRLEKKRINKEIRSVSIVCVCVDWTSLCEVLVNVYFVFTAVMSIGEWKRSRPFYLRTCSRVRYLNVKRDKVYLSLLSLTSMRESPIQFEEITSHSGSIRSE